MDQQTELTDGPTDREGEKTLTRKQTTDDKDRVKERKPLTLSYKKQTDRWTNRQSEGEQTFDFVLQETRLTDGPTDRVKESKPLTLSYKNQTDRWTNRQSEGEQTFDFVLQETD
ncbi:Hypothetical predicted protein [Mytilus galloprovincialis]|uniref:Uncharacterized protein n=1 Tax=Mytilus galloprovincialis TaxID=29158 RepID=A0A8B6C509_MYTGA|nr:Hypothetical predicted protein [Mytilus galloprovincialis]